MAAANLLRIGKFPVKLPPCCLEIIEDSPLRKLLNNAAGIVNKPGYWRIGSKNSTGSPFRSCTLEEFCSRLDTSQIEGELVHLFRESPEFGQNLSNRLTGFLETPNSGSLTLVGAGGEAAVFFDAESQQVIKLSGPPSRL